MTPTTLPTAPGRPPRPVLSGVLVAALWAVGCSNVRPEPPIGVERAGATAPAVAEGPAEAPACEDPGARTPADLDSLRAAVRPGLGAEVVTRLPDAVAETRAALLAAARAGDAARLRALADGRVFRETLGPEPGPDELAPDTRGADAIPPLIAAALADPTAVRFDDLEREGAVVYVWPVYAVSDGTRLSAREVACIRSLYGDDVARGVRFSNGAFVGPSVGIASDGTWTSFTAGGS